MASYISKWKEYDGFFIRYNGRRGGWQIRSKGQVSPKVFVNAKAAINYGERSIIKEAEGD